MTDPLGRSQVLPYLVGLAARGHRISLLSLEKPDRLAAEGRKVRAICERSGIDWRPLSYRRKPPVIAGVWNNHRLARRASRLHRQKPFDLVHARSDLASLAGRRLWTKGGARFLYDMRALWPDERVDGGAWPQTSLLFRAIYRKFKRHQAEFIARADAVVCLTAAAKVLVEQWPGHRTDASVTVIPCSADFDHFTLPSPSEREIARQGLGLGPSEKLVTYLGSIGAWYMLDEMLDFFAVYRRRYSSARFLVVTPDAPAPIVAAAKARGVDQSLLVRSASREQVPGYLAAADLGLFFIRPVASKRVSCPTKLGEMLAAGLPVIANSGVGDVADILRQSGGGATVDRFDEAAYEEVIDAVERLQHDPQAVRDKARAWFDVEQGVAAYDAVYAKLVEKKSTQ